MSSKQCNLIAIIFLVPVKIEFYFLGKEKIPEMGIYLAPPVGLEPTTLRLTAACSTD